jgi:hypothetical protein
MLSICAILGGLCGFILVAPVVFAKEFKAFWRKQMKRLRDDHEASLARARKEREEHPYRLLVQEMIEKNSFLFGVNFVLLLGWFLVAVLFFVGFTYYPWVVVGWLGISALILLSSHSTYSYTQDDETLAKEDLVRYTEHNTELKQLAKSLLILPITICILTYKALLGIFLGIFWCLCNLGFFAKLFLLTLAITFEAVASLNRYLAALGAIVGCIVGWSSGKNEWVAMFVGGLVGNGIYFLLRLVLRILPDPKTPWPTPVKVFV